MDIGELSASLEDYLEAVFHIEGAKGAARPKDIAARLGVNNSSVTGALRSLASRELVNYAPYDVVTLTDSGRKVAEEVVRRHEALKRFFVEVLAVDPELAESAACKMEHEIPREIVERIIQFVEFVEICPRGGAQFLDGFGYRCAGAGHDSCQRCLADVAERVTLSASRGKQ